MIFITVGTQLPFDRLLKLVDKVASELPEEKFFAQIGQSRYEPKAMGWVRDIDELTYHQYLSESELIIGHAGMGTIISAVDYGIPVIIVPRHFENGEHRNNHQVSTAKRFSGKAGVIVFDDIIGLKDVILASRAVQECDIDNSVSVGFSSKIKNVIYKELL